MSKLYCILYNLARITLGLEAIILSAGLSYYYDWPAWADYTSGGIIGFIITQWIISYPAKENNAAHP